MPLTGNYGAVLQNYALQSVLRSLGHEPITLDFLPAITGRAYIHHICYKFTQFIKTGDFDFADWLPMRQRKHIPTIEFMEKHIESTPVFWHHYRKSHIKKNKLDAIVVGSDQVWRPKFVTCIEDMFLRFSEGENIPRVAYAASFGTSEWEYSEKQAKNCRKLIEKFDAVSVREASGVDLAYKLGAKKPIEVLDPTLLLGRDGFSDIIREYIGKPGVPYIAAYILDEYEEIDLKLDEFCKSTGITECVRFPSEHPDIGPGEWLDLIISSKFLITDSFHGTVFAILNHIPFFTLVNVSRGADRFNALLKPLGLEHVMLTNLNEIEKERIQATTFNWEDIDSILEERRKTSYDFLKVFNK